MIEHIPLTKHRVYHQKKMHFGTFTVQGFIDEHGELLQVNPKAVSVFIGLNDKKGNPIYTGDILKDYQNRISIVRFLVKGGAFVKTSKGPVNVSLSAPMAGKCSVIGNVFESGQAKTILKDIAK